MTAAKSGDNVKVHYTGKLDDGRVFDTSVDKEPLKFILGDGQLIPGFENAVQGMTVGDKKTIKIPAEDAYGPHRKELLVEISKEQLPQGMNAEIGQQLQAKQPDGQILVFTITDITEEKVMLDGNHPLAGQDLTFEIELVEIV